MSTQQPNRPKTINHLWKTQHTNKTNSKIVVHPIHGKSPNVFLLWLQIYTEPTTPHYAIKSTKTHGHLLAVCENKFLKELRIARHNVVVHQLTNQLKSCIQTCHLKLTNMDTNNNSPQDNTNPPWILNCICNTSKCTCLTKLRLDIIYIKGVVITQHEPFMPTIHLYDYYILLCA